MKRISYRSLVSRTRLRNPAKCQQRGGGQDGIGRRCAQKFADWMDRMFREKPWIDPSQSNPRFSACIRVPRQILCIANPGQVLDTKLRGVTIPGDFLAKRCYHSVPWTMQIAATWHRRSTIKWRIA